MPTDSLDEELQDNDPTDELPILTDAILGENAEHTASMPGSVADAEDTGRYQKTSGEARQSAAAADLAAARLQKDLDARSKRLSTLEAELARLQQRWSDTDASLSERDTELTQLRAELTDREAAMTEQRTALERSSKELREHKTTIADLTAALELERDKAAALERKLEEIETERAIAREDSKQAGDDATMTRLREEVAALSQHIENRNAVWHDQAETLTAQSALIRELEIEVAQRLARQLEAERYAENEAASARTAREKLGGALDSLKQKEQVGESREATQTPEPKPISDEGRVAQLRRELAQTVILQAGQGDDAETLSRLAELEAAIMSLENQMETGPSGLDARPLPEPAKLICLTAEKPTEFVLDKATVTIGRGAACDIQIGTHYISREHARITTGDSGCFIEDLGSRNGVFVNAVKVERQNLDADDLVTVGDTQFRYQPGGNG